jgi:hypothetical protein
MCSQIEGERTKASCFFISVKDRASSSCGREAAKVFYVIVLAGKKAGKNEQSKELELDLENLDLNLPLQLLSSTSLEN